MQNSKPINKKRKKRSESKLRRIRSDSKKRALTPTRKKLVGLLPLNDDFEEKRRAARSRSRFGRSILRSPSRKRRKSSFLGSPYSRTHAKLPLSPEKIHERYENIRKRISHNKITRRNAFDTELNLAEYVEDMISDGIEFEKAGLYIDAASRMYVKRIDFAHEQAFQMLTKIVGKSDAKQVEQYQRKKRKRKVENTFGLEKDLKRNLNKHMQFRNVMQERIATTFSAADSTGLLVGNLRSVNGVFAMEDSTKLPWFSTIHPPPPKSPDTPPHVSFPKTHAKLIPKVFGDLIHECIHEGVDENILDHLPEPKSPPKLLSVPEDVDEFPEPEFDPGLDDAIPMVSLSPHFDSVSQMHMMPDLPPALIEKGDKVNIRGTFEEFTKFYDETKLQKLTWQDNWRKRHIEKLRHMASQKRLEVSEKPRKRRKLNLIDFTKTLDDKKLKDFKNQEKQKASWVSEEELEEWKKAHWMLPKDLKLTSDIFFRYFLFPDRTVFDEESRDQASVTSPQLKSSGLRTAADIASQYPELDDLPDLPPDPADLFSTSIRNLPDIPPDPESQIDSDEILAISEPQKVETEKARKDLKEMRENVVRVAFAAKRINVKYVKHLLWDIIQEHEKTDFQELLDELAVKLPQVVLDHLTIPFITNALLHMCNERGLTLSDDGGMIVITLNS